MRTLEVIKGIKETISEPYVVDNFVSNKDILELIQIYERGTKTHKNTGPVTLDINNLLEKDVFKRLLAGIQTEIGPFEVTAGLFFQTSFPHVIHNDDTFQLPDTVYKGITIPLQLNGFINTYPKLCFFDQFYFHGPAKFYRDSYNIPTYYNKQIYEYDFVDGLVDESFVDEHNYFTHLDPKWLRGLSLHSAVDWIPGKAIIFDSTRLHCASDFRSLGIKSKLGLSIFTRKV